MTKPAPAMLRIPVGVIVERRKASTDWSEFVWRPVAILSGSPGVEPWTELSREREHTIFYAGDAQIELYRSEVGNYQSNLSSGKPSIWVAMSPRNGEPPFALAAVTVDPAEGEGLTEPGQGIVEAVPMPRSIHDTLARFLAEHPAAQPFQKRQRDDADPQAMARRGLV